MKSLLRNAVLSLFAVAFVVCSAQWARADRFVYRSYYAGPYYAGTAVEYRRPFTPFYAPRVAYYPSAINTYAGPVYSTYYRAPVYGGPVYSAPVYGAPNVVNYPGTSAYYNYGASYAPAVPAVVYPLPSVVYPPAVFPY